ncbi:YraN family protein [Hydrogenophaga taeniospiralis]|uniref:YraN family protein n=1 Tax=Hydrogenophaga taeniospiralis TaxID=65656 RepID=UPI001CFA6F49|nr:YraN family protein [Hydrogenophaga taeniospiralis]UCU94839.1 YraN family protein [Hydrogenophaga taeniospiralis]
MWFSRKQGPSGAAESGPTVTTKQRGDAAEDAALEHLQRHGLRLVQRNFRTPGRGGGEVDLIMRDRDGTLVFVEVRQRASASRGGAGGSITALKQRRIVFAARHFLQRLGSEPPCRFDVVLIQGRTGAPEGDRGAPVHIEWLRAAFDATATF